MKVIEIHHPYRPEEIPQDDVVLVLGFFDGVHTGHQEVIRRGREEADKQGLKLAVMTFNHHPSIVFQKIKPDHMKYLTTLAQKERHMAALGVDYLYVIEFTSSFASLAPQAFVDQYMIGLKAKVVVAGFDYTYGPKDTANMNLLPEHIQGRAKVVKVPKQTTSSTKISSTEIRAFMQRVKWKKLPSTLAIIMKLKALSFTGMLVDVP